VGPLQVLDLSAAGFAAASPEQVSLPPGSVLESFELLLGERTIWSGDAVVVHLSGERIGGRFTSGVLDLQHLRVGATLEGRMSLLREQSGQLPAEWRATVGDLRQLLEDARNEVEEFERAEMGDPLQRLDDEGRLFEGLLSNWGKDYYAAIARLHAMSSGLDKRAVVLGRAYASSMLMPVLMACPMHRRAYEKPLGYAGDYRTIELYFTRELVGDGLFGRFLHAVGQNYGLSHTVIAREGVARAAVRAAAEADGTGPVRVLALAAGPAIELRRWLDEMEPLRRPLELILLDQDRAAHETVHRHLTRILLERHRGASPVTVQYLHSSVRQMLKPVSPDDHRMVAETLADLDLVYSMGLYDYLPDPVAASLTRLLYSRLRAGGRLLVGNLVETPDTTWLMEYVLGWSLVYRTEETLLHLADRLTPAPSQRGITRDATGRCLFLDITSMGGALHPV